jgi:hypothetical protein
MPHVNGNRYRSFGQGARRENEKSAMSTDNNRSDEGSNEVHEGEGSQATVTHNEETGKYHIKHADGSKHIAENKSEMLDHLDGHFPKDEEEEGDYNEPEEEQAGEEGLGSLDGSLKSLLG